MKLFNKTIDNKLFKQYSLGSDLSKQKVVTKIFNPYGTGSWYILNSDPNDPDYLWAIVDLGQGAEVGSVSRSDLEIYRNKMGYGFERDLYFDEINAQELYQGLVSGKYYADGGEIEVVYERIADFKNKPIRLLLLNRGKDQKAYSFSGKEQVAILDSYNRNKQEDLKKLWDLKGYETKYSDGGNVIDAFQIRTVRGQGDSPTEILTTDQEVKFKKGGKISESSSYIPTYDILKVHTKDGKVFENIYSETAVISGIYVSDKPLREKNPVGKNQIELFKKGGIPKSAIYIPRYNVDFIETESGKIEGNYIYGGVWVDMKKQFRLVEEAKEKGTFNRKNEKSKFEAIYNGKKISIEAESLLDAKNKAIAQLKVPKTKVGLLSVNNVKDPMASLYAEGGDTGRKIEVINEGEKFDEKKYKAIYEDFDNDGTSNIDDANPLDKSKKGNVEQVELKETFSKLLKVKAELDSVMYSAIDKLDEKAPKDADIYARTKTPYSILKKLVDKRMLDPQKGLTDMIGTTIAVENQKELEQVRDDIDGGLLGKILDRDDFYENPKAGYRAYHYIVEYNGYPIEVQLKTKNMKKLNEVSHEFYKNGTLDGKGLEIVSKTFEMADKGDKKAIQEVENLLKNKKELASRISTSKSFDNGGYMTYKDKAKLIYANQMLTRAVMKGDLTIDEANSGLAFEIAEEEAENWLDDEEMGSSDFGYMYQNFLRDYREIKAQSFAKGGSIKDAEITKGKVFELINGDVVEIVRLFKENINEDWVEYKRNGETKENSVKELRLFINRLSGKIQKSFRERRNEYLEKLGQKEADVWDKIGAESGSEIRNDEKMLKAYADGVEEMLQKEGVGKGSFDQEDYDYFTDENWHLFNEFLVWNSYYEPEMTKTEKAWREKNYADPKSRTYVSNPKIISVSNDSKPKSSNYVPKAKIKKIVLEKDGKEIVLESKDVLNGVNLYEGGGKLKNDHVYFAKRFVKEVITEDGDKLSPSNGYWVKKSALKTKIEPKSKSTTNFKKQYKFEVGDVVWDKSNKTYGVVLNNFDNPKEGARGEIRLDSDGMQSIFEFNKDFTKETGYNLVPYGSKEDTGDKNLDSLKNSAKSIIEMTRDKGNKDQYIKIYSKLLNSKRFSSGGTTKKVGVMFLAKQIRKEGESWQSALKRAGEQIRKN